LALFLIACSSDKTTGTLVLTTGGEPASEVFADVTQLRVETATQDGGVSTIATVAMPAGETVDLADIDSSTVASLRVRGVNDAGVVLARGTSIPVQFAAIGDGTNLSLFIQRSGAFARLPSPLSDGRAAPVVAVMAGRYLFEAGGDDPDLATHAQLYDLATYTPMDSPPTLPRAPQSVAFIGTTALLIDAQGGTWFSFADSTHAEAQAPIGATFADVAGGATIPSPDGSFFIVGGTRQTGDPTGAVLHVTADGKLAFTVFEQRWRGATAVWIEGGGLLITGGGAASMLLAADGTKTPLATTVDPTQGASGIVVDATHVRLMGGVDSSGNDAQVRLLDVSCDPSATDCTPPPQGISLPVPLVRSEAFALNGGEALLIGDAVDGVTHAYRVTASDAIEVPLKVGRKGARAVKMPTEGFGVLGGAGEIESFAP
jgi:hypothetical protein